MSKVVRYIDDYGNRLHQPIVECEFQSMVFAKDSYHGDMKALKAAMMDFIMTLMENEYECRVRADDFGIGVFVVEYAHDNGSYGDDWGNDRLMWVSSDEEDDIKASRAALADPAPAVTPNIVEIDEDIF